MCTVNVFLIFKIFPWWTPCISKNKIENIFVKQTALNPRRGLLTFEPASRCHFALGPRRKLTKITSNRVRLYFIYAFRLILLFHKRPFRLLKGHYACSKCTYPLFSSSSKYEHSSPWPAFTKTVEKDSVRKVEEPRQKGAFKVWLYFVIWSDLSLGLVCNRLTDNDEILFNPILV